MKYLQDVCLFVHSYTLRVVGSGIKAQSTNPEVKVKGADPVINQIIDKLKHINQVSISHCLDIASLISAALTPLKVYISIPHSVTHMGTVSSGNLLILRAFFFSWNIKYVSLAFGLFFKVHRNSYHEKKRLLTGPKPLSLCPPNSSQQNNSFISFFTLPVSTC